MNAMFSLKRIPLRILGLAICMVVISTRVHADCPIYLQNVTTASSLQIGSSNIFRFQYLQQSNPTPVVVRIFDETGTLMRTLGPAVQETGLNEQQWDGTNDTGAFVPPGRYFYQIAANFSPLDSRPTAIKEPGIRVDAAAGVEDRGVYGPAVVRIACGLLRMYYSSFSSAPAIYVSSATSSDSGLTWTKEGVRFQVSNTNAGGTPTLVLLKIGPMDADTFRMYYVNGDGTQIKSALTTDGLNFTQDGVRLTTGAPGSFDQSGVSYPEVARLPDDRIRLYYDAYDGSHDRIMSAVSTDGLTFVKDTGIRIDIGPSGAPDQNQALSPSVRLLLDSTWEMNYGGNDGTGARLLRATSPDGLVWTKDSAVVYNHQGTDEFYGAFEPNTIPLSDGMRRIVYSGTSSSFIYRIFSLMTGEGGSLTLLPDTTPKCDTPPADLVAWWPGDSHPRDIADRRHDAALLNGAGFDTGIVYRGFSFDGANDYLTVDDDTELDIRDSITIEAWVKPNGVSANSGTAILTKRDAYNLFISSVTRQLEFIPVIGGNTGIVTHSTSALPLGVFSHIAVTYDGSLIKFYINGVLDSATLQTGRLDTSARKILIGAADNDDDDLANGFFWNGVIDELSLYKRALADTEIAAIFASGSAGKCRITPGVLSKPLRVQDVTLQRTFIEHESTTIGYRVEMETTAQVLIRIFDDTGRLVRSFGPFVRSTGVYSQVWDGMDETGSFLPPASYYFQIAAPEAPFDSRPDLQIDFGIRINTGAPPEDVLVQHSSVVRLHDDTYLMYYAGRTSGNNWVILGATSPDGLTWTKIGPVIQGPGSTSNADPDAIVLPDGRVRVYHEADNNGDKNFIVTSSISSDGIHFTRELGWRIPPNLHGSEDARSNVPRVIRLADGRYRLYYMAIPALVVLSAVSEDGVTFIADAGVRIPKGTAGAFDSERTATGGIEKRPDGSFRMFYTGGDGSVFRVLSATSQDGLVWDKDTGVRIDVSADYPAGAAFPSIIEYPDGTTRWNFDGMTSSTTTIRSAFGSEVGGLFLLPQVPQVSDTTPPQVRIDFPPDSSVVRDTLEVRGRVFDYTNAGDTGTIQRYTLSIASSDQFPLNYTVLFTGNAAVESGSLGVLDLTSVSAGNSVLRLQAEDTSGNISETTVNIVIERSLPDLVISSDNILLSDTNPNIGDLVTVTAIVSNQGTADAQNVEVALLSDGVQVGTAQIPFIPHATSSETVVFQVTATHDGLQILTVKVDPANRIAELSELQNSATQSLIVGEEFSGLILVHASVTPEIAVSGDIVTIRGIAEYNPSYSVGGPVSGGIVEIFYQGLDAGDSRLDDLRAAVFTGSTRSDGFFEVSIPIPVESGTYTVVASVTDRTARGIQPVDFGVTTPTGPDLLVRVVTGTTRDNFGTPRDFQAQDIGFDTQPIAGQPVTFTGLIFNVGRATASNVEYKWSVNGIEQKFDTLPSLSGFGNSVQVQFTPSPNLMDSGFITVTLEVDPNNRISDEFRENNNAGSRVIRVWADTWDRLPNRRR